MTHKVKPCSCGYCERAFKRGVHGIWHHVSPKHLGRYVDEATFRLNAGNVAIHTNQRLDAFVDGVVGKRITYKEVIA